MAHHNQQFGLPLKVKKTVALLGITGWAQINGRNAITWNQKFKPVGRPCPNSSPIL